MTAPSSDEQRDAVDEVAIRALIAEYADVVNRRAWPELDALFVADAPVAIDLRDRPVINVVGAPALGEFIGNAIERFEFFEFVALNVRVVLRVDNQVDRAGTRTYMCELRQDHDGTPSRAFGVYQDQLMRTTGGWRFARRWYQSMARGQGSLDVMAPAEIEKI